MLQFYDSHRSQIFFLDPMLQFQILNWSVFFNLDLVIFSQQHMIILRSRS